MAPEYKDFLLQYTKVASGRIANFSSAPDILQNARKADKYIAQVEYFLQTIECTDAAHKKAILIYSGGQEFSEIDSLYEDGDEADVYKKYKAKLHKYFNISRLRDTTRIEFHQAVQQSGESVNEFYYRLDQLWKDTGYKTTADSTSKSDFIADRIVAGIRSDQIRKRLLEESDRTLEKVLNISNAFAAAQSQVKNIAQNTANVSKVSFSPTWEANKSSCGYCGDRWHPKADCPAAGKTCKSCGKLNHYSKVCRSSKSKSNKKKKPFFKNKRTNLVKTDNDDDEPLTTHDQNVLSAVVNTVTLRDI